MLLCFKEVQRDPTNCNGVFACIFILLLLLLLLLQLLLLLACAHMCTHTQTAPSPRRGREGRDIEKLKTLDETCAQHRDNKGNNTQHNYSIQFVKVSASAVIFNFILLAAILTTIQLHIKLYIHCWPSPKYVPSRHYPNVYERYQFNKAYIHTI